MTTSSKVVTFTSDTKLGQKGQAVALALALLRKAKQDTWDDLLAAIDADDPDTMSTLATLHLTDQQRRTVETHAGLVRLVGTRPPLRTVAFCVACGEHLVVVGAVPSRCTFTRHCGGTYSKVTAAKTSLVSEDQVAPEDEGATRVA